MNWQPIETAPKDELILVARTKRMCGPCAAMNHSQDGWVTETPGEWVSIYTPSHWMPLPAAPGSEAMLEYIEGGRESVDDALAIVESFGTSIDGVNDEFARQIILAAEVRRLRGLYEQAASGRSAFRHAYRKARAAILPPLGCPACGITHDSKECPQEAAKESP